MDRILHQDFPVGADPVNLFVAGFIGEPPMNFIEARIENGCIRLPDNHIDLSLAVDRQVLEQYEGQEIMFGFRPEAVRLAESDDVSQAYRMQCAVELVELLGDNTNIYADLSGIKSIIKVDPHISPEIGQEFEFYIPYGSIYLFDKQTTRRIKTRVN